MALDAESKLTFEVLSVIKSHPLLNKINIWDVVRIVYIKKSGSS
jgi:hypothetical protein